MTDDGAEAAERDGAERERQEAERRQARPRNRVRRFFLDLLERLHRWAEAGWAPHAVATWGAMQGSVVPGPADAMLVPLGIADPPKVGRLAVFALAGAVVGGIVAWLIGVFAFDEVGRPLLHLLGIDDGTVARSMRLFDEHGWLLVLLSTVSPLSTKLVCMAAGAFGVPFLPFTAALTVGRAARFTVVALLVRFAGDRVERWRQRYVRRRKGATAPPPPGDPAADAAP